MTATAANPVVDEIEKFRQLVIEATHEADVMPKAQKCMDKLNALYAKDKEAFTPEDIRFVNKLRGVLAQRLTAHEPKGEHTPKAKRKGDTLLHCWRCLTPVDERFSEICPGCSEPKQYQWRTCPVCNACGCQRSEKKLV